VIEKGTGLEKGVLSIHCDGTPTDISHQGPLLLVGRRDLHDQLVAVGYLINIFLCHAIFLF
jgi:hypothetical protein